MLWYVTRFHFLFSNFTTILPEILNIVANNKVYGTFHSHSWCDQRSYYPVKHKYDIATPVVTFCPEDHFISEWAIVCEDAANDNWSGKWYDSRSLGRKDQKFCLCQRSVLTRLFADLRKFLPSIWMHACCAGEDTFFLPFTNRGI